jgi:Sec-independent protein translocase protein TatA
MATDNSDLTKDLIELLGGGFIGSAARDVVGWLRGAKKDSAEAEATLKDADTRHLQALKDGWSARVNDLTDEVHKLRDEIVSLRQAYDLQQINHAQQMLAAHEAHAEQMAAVRAAHAKQMAALRQELDEARQARGIGI